MRRVHVGIVPGHVGPAQVVGKDNNLRDIKYEKWWKFGVSNVKQIWRGHHQVWGSCSRRAEQETKREKEKRPHQKILPMSLSQLTNSANVTFTLFHFHSYKCQGWNSSLLISPLYFVLRWHYMISWSKSKTSYITILCVFVLFPSYHCFRESVRD